MNKHFKQIFIAIVPEGFNRSMDACLCWLTKEFDGGWLLFFDNADDVKLNLGRFFPRCASGNILVTTRNPELCIYSGKDGDANVTVMDPEDATNLLFLVSREEEDNKNKTIAERIAQVLFTYLECISN